MLKPSLLDMLLLSACLASSVATALALDNGLGLTPQMGWNSWNKFHCGITSDLIAETIKSLKSENLAAVGYTFANMDDCWAGSRDKDTNVIQPDKTAFPHGIKPLADLAHSLNLKFGLYSDAGFKTCAGRPGSLHYERIDAATYARWGVDYLKYDNCNTDGTKPEIRYPVMRDALNSTKRSIFFSMCEWGVDNPATWAPLVGNSWRTTTDIGDYWASVLSRADQNDVWWSRAGPGGWNDPDMLEVGNGGLSTAEEIAHFSLWSLMKAPLLIGCDIRNISAANPTAYKILTNSAVIAINQDALGVQGHKVSKIGDLEVWAGPLAPTAGRKQFVALLLNRGTTTARITAHWKDVGIAADTPVSVYDLWQHKSLPDATNSFSANVQSHSVVMVRMTEGKSRL